MRRLKIIFILMVIFVIVYIFISLIYKNVMLSKEYVDAYILNNDILRGNKISNQDICKVKILKKNYDGDINFIVDRWSDKDLSKINLVKGQVITKDLLISEEEYICYKDKEIISLELDKNDIATNSKLEKGAMVNIYFTETSQNDNSQTVKLIEENVRIIDVNDDEANSVSKDKQASKIVIALSREKILLVNSYKRRGLFNISLIT